MTVARQANGFICRYGHAFPYPVCLRHVYRRMLAYRFAAAAPRTASGFHDQFSVLKPNRVFHTTSPARAAQYAGFGIESYLCLAKRRKRPAQFTLTGHDATGLDILSGNVHQHTPGGINLVDGYIFKRPRRFTASAKRQIQPGNRQQPVRILLRVDTDKTNVVLRVPQQKLIHPWRTVSKRPNKRIATQKAFSRRDAGDGLSGADEQAVTAFNTAAVINRDA
ncbi:hypothetical protein OUHCRE10_20600 [Enterobacter hormaechei subsp. xiangfangensis]|nr:hypothetical protein SL264_29450 [Enterobacter cloacae]BCZ63167.1 hypothetical protein SL269_29510 [Klebsiella aerogenes]